MKRVGFVLLAVAGLAVSAGAETSSVRLHYPDGTRILRTEGLVEAPVERVWEAFTTKSGIESWMVAAAEIDFRLSGVLRTTYDAKQGIGGPGTIVHRLIAYEPLRMLAFKLERAPDSAPPPIRNMAGKTWFVVRMEPAACGGTRVEETQVGFGDGAEWDKALEFFQRGNEWTMKELEKHFAPAAERKEGTVQ
jgi:uncharacterized protein YndB with AHSA1/START domain